jgi:hypothetical protein
MRASLLIAVSIALVSAPASAGELFGGVYVHDVKTPLNLSGIEPGIDLQLGYRAAGMFGTRFQPYAFAALNSSGETSYAAVGVSRRFGIGGKAYVRPGLGLAERPSIAPASPPGRTSPRRPARAPAPLPSASAPLVRVLGDLGGIVVADLRRQRGHQHQRPVHQVGNAPLVRLQPVERALGEAFHADRSRSIERSTLAPISGLKTFSSIWPCRPPT